MYIDDCLMGTQRMLASDIEEPINLGSDQSVTINELVDIVESIAGITLKRAYNLDSPKGVNGRNSDNTCITERLGWAPNIRLQDGLEKRTAGFTMRTRQRTAGARRSLDLRDRVDLESERA
jgi:nucleoside-diphosphate-sugar epimerase